MFERLTENAKDLLRERPSLFLVGSSFTVAPLEMSQIEGGQAAGSYCIDGGRAGPYLRLVLPAQYEEKGKVCLSPGGFPIRHRCWTRPERAS